MAAWLKKLLASALSLGMVLAVSELYLRRADPLGTRYFDETYVYFGAMVPDTVVYYHHPPSATQTYPSWAVTFNADGLRGNSLPVRKNAGVFRLLILGDSVAFGWGVPTAQTVGPQLAELLATRYGSEVEVVVDAVGSWNSVTQLRDLYSRFDRLDPDAVLVLYVGNDSENKFEVPGWGHGIPYAQPPRPLLHRLAWVKTLKGLSLLHGSKPPKTAEQLQLDEEGEHASIWALGEMQRLCQAAHIPFSVFSYEDNLVPLHRLASETKALGLPWLSASADLPRSKMERYGNSPLDGHLNGAGLRIFAEWTAEHLPAAFRSGPSRVGRVSRTLLDGIDGDVKELPWGQRSRKGFIVPEAPLFFLVRAVPPDTGPHPPQAQLTGFPPGLKLPTELRYGRWQPVLLTDERSAPLMLRLATPGQLEVTPAMLLHRPPEASAPPAPAPTPTPTPTP